MEVSIKAEHEMAIGTDKGGRCKSILTTMAGL